MEQSHGLGPKSPIGGRRNGGLAKGRVLVLAIARGGRGSAAGDDAMILVTLPSSDRFYLTQAEAGWLADDIRQHLVCRRTDQADEPVVVADTPLAPAEAWKLVDHLETEGTVDWQKEGF